MDNLRRLGRGQTLADFAEAIEKASKAARETGKKTAVAFTITFERLVKDPESAALTLNPTVTTRIPTTERPRTILYLQNDGTLGGSDPAQAELFPRPTSVAGGLTVTADADGVVTNVS